MADPNDVRWLDPVEREAWLALAQLLIRLPDALEAQLQRDADLSQFEYFVLAHLSEAPGRRLRLSTLAAMAHGSLSRLSHVVTRLERRGYVERRPSEDDARSTDAVLTDAGWEKIVASAPGHVACVRDLVVDALDPDTLVRLGDACRAILRQVGGECAGPAR